MTTLYAISIDILDCDPGRVNAFLLKNISTSKDGKRKQSRQNKTDRDWVCHNKK